MSRTTRKCDLMSTVGRNDAGGVTTRTGSLRSLAEEGGTAWRRVKLEERVDVQGEAAEEIGQ